MSEVARFDDFSHLEILDDGKQKANTAQRAVASLRRQVAGHMQLFEEQREIKDRREKGREKRSKNVETQKRLDQLRDEYVALVPMAPQKRG